MKETKYKSQTRKTKRQQKLKTNKTQNKEKVVSVMDFYWR